MRRSDAISDQMPKSYWYRKIGKGPDRIRTIGIINPNPELYVGTVGRPDICRRTVGPKEEGRRDKVLPNLRIPNPLTTILNQVYLKLCRL